MKALTNLLLMAVICCMTLVASAQNRCLHYDGNNDRVTFTSPLTSAGLMNNFSVACRFRAENTDNQGFIYRLFGWGTDRFEFGDQNGTLVFYTNSTGTVPTGATGIRDGQCHNVVVTKSSSPNVVRVFYDGTLVLTQPLAAPLTLSSLARVGDWAGGATAPSRWKGLIDDFEVYEGALTAAQVATLNGYGTIFQPLLLQFPFNQGIPAGVNTGLTNVINTVGAAGTAQNFAMTGPTSNWVLWPCGPQQTPLNINCNLSTDQQFMQVCNDPGLCGATVFYPTPTITGGTPPYSINTTFPSGGFMPLGYTQVCNTVIDATGATATCCFWVLVQDCEAPTIFCASNVVCNDPGLCAGTLPDVTGSAGAIDNCGPVTIAQSPAAGTTLPVGLSLVTMTATDASGNTATCYNYVQVNDCEAPTVICPNDQTVCNDVGVCSAWVLALDPYYYDNCNDATGTGGVSIVSNQPTGWVNLPAMQSHLFSFVATDASGNTATCQYAITVLDCEAPVVTCPANQTVCNDLGLCSATVNATDASYSDNCGIAYINVNQPFGLLSLPVGVHTWTFIGADYAGNVGTCSYSISILDCEPPTILCPQQGTVVTVCNTPGKCGVELSSIAPPATDNCTGPVTITSAATSTPFLPIGNSWVCFIATDAAGNVSDCCFQVHVNDCEPPTIICPANQTVCVCGTYTPATPIVSDNCGTVTMAPPIVSGTYLAGTTTTITYLATDANGNTATCSYTVTVPACTTPVITLVNSITSTSFKIFYTKPLCATSMQYQIRYQIGAGWSAWTTVTYAATGASKLITGLVCGRTYQVRIRAKCCNVYSSWSAVKTVTTKACGTNMTAQNDADPTTTVATKLEVARLYPNPATNVVNIEIAQLDAQTTLSLTDLNGRTLATTTPDESGLTQLEVGNLPSGVYVVVIRNSQTVQTLRFVKE